MARRGTRVVSPPIPNTMRTHVLSALVLLAFVPVQAQFTPPNPIGFEGLIVEPYYVADDTDAAHPDGGPGLTAGTKVYRVYADLLPGYKLITVGGFPGHPMTLNTTTSFYNNADRGEAWGRDIPANRIGDNTLAIDSWLAFGAATNQHWGVLKSADTDGSIVGGANNNDGLLNAQDPWAGIPITQADGLYSAGSAPPQLVFLGDAPTCFDPDGASTYSNDNFAWAVLGGIEGPTPENRLLIGQFVTDGDFSFCLNITVKLPVDSICADPHCHNFMEFLGSLQPADTANGGWAVQNKFFHPTMCFNSASAVVDCEGTAGGSALPGTSCDDGIEATTNDVYSEACVCQGEDCLGVPGGSALPGEPCDDGDADTINDSWTLSCECAGIPTAVHEQQTSSFRLDPNPTHDLVRLNFGDAKLQHVHLGVLNGLGQVLISTSIGTVEAGHTHVLDLSSLSTGTYFVRVTSTTGTATLPVQRQ